MSSALPTAQPDAASASPTRPALTVYYDGACPVCSREIAVYQRQPGAEACAWVDASRCEATALGSDLDPARALARMHVRRADGTLVQGAAAFAEMWKAFPATRWLGRVASWKPVTWVLDQAYSLFLVLRPLWRAAPAAPAGTGPGAAAHDASRLREALTPALQAELRSDHAGETGAVWIYRGILGVSRDPAVRQFAAHHLATEQEHLRLIEQWEPGYRRSRLLPIWRVAGWITGALPAILGPRAVYRTIQSVETFVDHHYQAQIDLIDSLAPHPERARLRELLLRCQADEVSHRDEAGGLAALGGPAGPIARAWGALVGAGSEAAVVMARRI